MTDIIEQLKNRACQEGQPHVGDDWKADHGHTDCWLYGQAVAEVERLRDRLVKIEALHVERDRLATELKEAAMQTISNIGQLQDALTSRNRYRIALANIYLDQDGTVCETCGREGRASTTDWHAADCVWVEARTHKDEL